MPKDSQIVGTRVPEMAKKKDANQGVKTRKRGRTVSNEGPLMEDSNKSRPEKSKRMEKQKACVKRRIDFSHPDDKIVKDSNNNATKTVAEKKKVRSGSNVSGLKTSDRVNWTKEFLDKVRKSNEKHAKKNQNKRIIVVTKKFLFYRK